MRTTRWALVLLGGLLAIGCATSGKARIDDNKLVGISAENMQGVMQARLDVARANDHLLRAKQVEHFAKDRVGLGEADVDRAQADLRQAKVEKELEKLAPALQLPTPEAAEADAAAPVRVSIDEAQLRVDTAKAEVEYLRHLAALATAERELNEERHELANARLDKAKWTAIDRQGSGGPKWAADAPRYDVRVAEEDSDVAKASAKVVKARAEVLRTYEAWRTLDRRLGGQRRVAVPPPPKG